MEYSKHVNSWKSLSLRWQNIFPNTWSAFMVKAQCHNIGVHIQKLLPFVSSNEAPNINIIHKNVLFGYHSLEIIFIRHTNFCWLTNSVEYALVKFQFTTFFSFLPIKGNLTLGSNNMFVWLLWLEIACLHPDTKPSLCAGSFRIP